MKEEIEAAVSFVIRLIKNNNNTLTDAQIEEFSSKLTAVLLRRFENHWYKEEPTKGQAYRCIRINDFEPVDTVLDQAAKECGMKFEHLGLPQELTLWVDPAEVCCR